MLDLGINQIHKYCLTLPYVTHDFPFDQTTMVFRVKGKIFLFLPLENNFGNNLETTLTFSFKISPDENLKLQSENPLIIPAFHLNKKHWATFYYSSESQNTNVVHKDFVLSLIKNSYILVCNNLKKSEKENILAALSTLS